MGEMIPLVQEFTPQEIKFHREASVGDGRRDGAAKLADETNTIGEFLTFLDWIGPKKKRTQPSEPTDGTKTMMNVGIMLSRRTVNRHLHSPVIHFGKELFLRPYRLLISWSSPSGSIQTGQANLTLSLRRL